VLIWKPLEVRKMGLEICVMRGRESLDSFRAGSYSGFHSWRTWLARVVGVDISGLSGYGGIRPVEGLPFEEMFNHSDCDGILKRKQCRNLSDDFAFYFFKALEEIKEDNEDENNENMQWFMSQYVQWHRAFDMVVNREATRLMFC
jgi:hypothetical protein